MTTKNAKKTTKPAAATKPAAEKAPKPVKTSFRETTAPADALNADGLLTRIDVAEIGFDAATHKPLGKSDFESEALWLQFKAQRMRERAASFLEQADRLDAEAKTAATIGDPKRRKQVKKMTKLAAQLAELTKLLEAEGVDVAEILPQS